MNPSDTYIILDIAGQHHGSLDTAQALIDEAKSVGANAIHLRCYHTDEVCRSTSSQHARIKRDELSYGNLEVLKRACDAVKLDLVATPSTFKDAQFLVRIQVAKIAIDPEAIAVMEMTNAIARLGRPMILRTGGQPWESVSKGVYHAQCGHHVTILHSHFTAEVPPLALLNLMTVSELIRVHPKCIIGYSSTTDLVYPFAMAYGLGARVFEITDSDAVDTIRECQLALGTPVRSGMTEGERAWMKVLQERE
jgi:sialic acid synthase SpsE